MSSADVPSPPELGVDGRVLEGIVTTLNVDGSTNISPMGPIVDGGIERLLLRPFNTSTTLQNLKRTGAGVFHITDDVLLLAQAAIGQPRPTPHTTKASKIDGIILADSCRWYAFEVMSLDESRERTSIVARVVERGVQREFLGFNRAKHAVVEAAILATRVHILDACEIMAEFERLAIHVAKTGGAQEHEAFELLQRHIASQLAQ